MLRRSAVATLFAAGHWIRATSAQKLAPYFEGAHGTAVLADVASRRLIAVHAPELAGGATNPPGSTLKPFVLAGLLETHRLSATATWRCPGDLTIAGRNLACSHPKVATPMDVRSALAYSCNCFVAHVAERLEPGELSRTFARYGLWSRSEWFGESEAPGESRAADSRLLALGEDGVLVTVAGLAQAYRRLALSLGRASLGPVLSGLEDAVEYGTAQRARVAGWKLAGKTGSVVAGGGAHLAWFAGFAPSRTPSVVVAVMLQGRSGGADAAPVAGRILDAYRRGTL
jgi:cell division protein FtsI/penicillin-binding protein 2